MESQEDKETVILNGREVTREELQRQQEAISKQKGATLQEVKEGEFKVRLQG